VAAAVVRRWRKGRVGLIIMRMRLLLLSFLLAACPCCFGWGKSEPLSFQSKCFFFFLIDAASLYRHHLEPHPMTSGARREGGRKSDEWDFSDGPLPLHQINSCPACLKHRLSTISTQASKPLPSYCTSILTRVASKVACVVLVL
jgi:hypothetical protein